MWKSKLSPTKLKTNPNLAKVKSNRGKQFIFQIQINWKTKANDYTNPFSVFAFDVGEKCSSFTFI